MKNQDINHNVFKSRSFTAPIEEVDAELCEMEIDTENAMTSMQTKVAKSSRKRPATTVTSEPPASRGEPDGAPVPGFAIWGEGILQRLWRVVTARAFQFAASSISVLLVAFAIWGKQSFPIATTSVDNSPQDQASDGRRAGKKNTTLANNSQQDPYLKVGLPPVASLERVERIGIERSKSDEVERIGIERSKSDEQAFQSFRSRLQEQLGSQADLIVTDRKEAQAMLFIIIKPSEPGDPEQIIVQARLIAKNGKQLWPEPPTWFERRGTPQTVAAEISASLRQARAQ